MVHVEVGFLGRSHLDFTCNDKPADLNIQPLIQPTDLDGRKEGGGQRVKLMSPAAAAPHRWSLHIVGKGREEGWWEEGEDESEMYSPLPLSLPYLPLFSSLLCSLHLSYLPLPSQSLRLSAALPSFPGCCTAMDWVGSYAKEMKGVTN